MLEHGGRLLAAVHAYDIPLERWLDLSTGINPNGWPAPTIPERLWRCLPEDEDGLAQAAADYYGTPHLLVTAGSQAAIQQLPQLRPTCRVAVFAPTYAEHQHVWVCAGHEVVVLNERNLSVLPDDIEALVLVNPNNPTGHILPVPTLLEWHARLAARGGWLVVDEAFMDTTPDVSLTPHVGLPGLVVLRSLGKFFGLAGARIGFALAWPELLLRLQEALGPWPVSGPARWVAQQALRDRPWQQAARQHLLQDSARLAALLTAHNLPPGGGTALFQWVPTPQAQDIHVQLAQQGILTRLFTAPSSLRFGLPGTAAAWQQLESALTRIGTVAS